MEAIAWRYQPHWHSNLAMRAETPLFFAKYAAFTSAFTTSMCPLQESSPELVLRPLGAHGEGPSTDRKDTPAWPTSHRGSKHVKSPGTAAMFVLSRLPSFLHFAFPRISLGMTVFISSSPHPASSIFPSASFTPPHPCHLVNEWSDLMHMISHFSAARRLTFSECSMLRGAKLSLGADSPEAFFHPFETTWKIASTCVSKTQVHIASWCRRGKTLLYTLDSLHGCSKIPTRTLCDYCYLKPDRTI